MKKLIVALAAMAALWTVLPPASAAGAASAKAEPAAQAQADTAGIEAFSDTTGAGTAQPVAHSSYSVSVSGGASDDMVERMSDFTSDAVITIVAILVMFFVAPVGILALLFYFIYKSRKQKLRLAEMAMAKGQPLPGGLLREQAEPAELVWRRGIRNVSVGLGLACVFYFFGMDFFVGIALFVAIYGGGQLVIARTSGGKTRKTGGADDYEEIKD